MIKSIHRLSLPEVLPTSSPFAASMLVLCLWLVSAMLPANVASADTVLAWGNNSDGRTTVPADLSGVTAIAAGYFHTVALLGTGVVGPTVLPKVTARSSGNNLTLLWPDSATGYRVESTLSLSPPLNWSSVAGSFQTNDGSISIVLPITGGQKFYRLVKP